MDKFESYCETSPCLFCLTPVERNRNIIIELKTNYWNYQDIVACSRKFLKNRINYGQYSESVCIPDSDKPSFEPLCVKCFKCAEKIRKVNKQLMELSILLEDLIEKSSLEINERISTLAADGSLLADEIKVEEVVVKEEIDVVAEEISDRIMDLENGEGDETEEDPLKLAEAMDVDWLVDVDEECQKSYFPSALLDTKHKCSICKITFASQHALKMHLKAHGRRKCMCDTCGSRFTTRTRLMEHCRIHEVEEFECDICGKKMNNERHMPQHKNCIHKLQKDCACDNCGYRCNSRNQLQMHILSVHENVKNYKCSICERSFGKKTDCGKHEVTHSRKPELARCRKQELTHSRTHELARCRKQELTNKKETERYTNKCKICGDRRFKSSSFLNMHQIQFHTAYTQQQSHCDKCGNKFLNGSELHKHSNRDAEKSCLYCKGIFESRCDLLIHIASIHPDENIPYKCHACGLVFTTVRFLSEHWTLEPCWKNSPTRKVLEIDANK